ncbi:hypothetical protein [Terrilactibacillus tamarindi]|nr:hypothetical protein [Terrilactibacillus tamarindi]
MIYTLALIFYVLSSFFPIAILQTLMAIFALLSVSYSLFYVRGPALIFGLIFLLLGSSLLFAHHASTASYVLSFGNMLQVLIVFALVPILSLPIQLGGYARDIQDMISQKLKRPAQLYSLTSILSYVFSSFMNLAALPITYYAIEPATRHYPILNKSRFLNRAITHGYAMPLLWAPVTPIVGIVLELTNASYVNVLPYLITLSFVGLGLDLVIGLFTSRIHRSIKSQSKQSQNETAAAIEKTEQKSKLSYRFLHVIVAIIILNICIALFEKWTPLSFLFLVSLLIIPFSLCWCFILGQIRPFFTGLKDHFNHHLFKMKNQFFIFLSAGFFITTLHMTHTDQVISHWISEIVNFTGVTFFLLTIPFIPLVLAFVGLHPAISLVLIAEAIHTNLAHVSPIILTLTMLGGAIPAFLMGPYNGTLGLMSTIMNVKPTTLSNWNCIYTMIYLFILTGGIQILLMF